MYVSAAPPLAPRAKTTPAVMALRVDERERDVQGVAIPRPEIHLVLRFGSAVHGGLDIHALGGRERVHRKLLRAGLRTVTARLQLGAAEAVLGVPASAIAGRIVALEDLWGAAATRLLCDRFALARDTFGAAAVLQEAVAERFAIAHRYRAHLQLVLAAADRLRSANVTAVADDLGLSERHLRRVFRETIGVGPKTFARLNRFRRALRTAHEQRNVSWATVASAAGYYDQAHLINDCRAIAGVTPETLLSEIRAAQSIG